MREWAEYEFILPDGSCRYEMIDLAARARPQVWSFKRMHDAAIVWPVEQAEQHAIYRAKRIRQLQQAHARGAASAGQVQSNTAA